jgi:uncharacterized membrane protein YfcA
VNALLVIENVRAIRRGQFRRVERPWTTNHSWFHRLSLKLRFEGSRIHVFFIPIVGIGFVIGFIGAVIGTGGNFVLVPILIYVLRVPIATVIGTSMAFTAITMASATVMHATNDYLVDVTLVLILIAGGVVGGAWGARIAQQMRAERLRPLLALVVLVLEIRFVFDLITTPDNLYSVLPLDTDT